MDDDLDGVFDDDEDESGTVARRERSAPASARSRPATKAKKRDARPNPLARLYHYVVNFVREVVAELQKVIWPTRRELVTYATVVVVFVAVVMAYVALLDLGFVKAMIFVFGAN
jgi:preprotein translocase subunit SecE